LVAQDETVTRVGANTIFSFDPANRTIDLKQGSLLFHSPHGKGGGTIHTGSATASVLGTTLIVGFNLGNQAAQVEIDTQGLSLADGAVLKGVLGAASATVRNGQLKLELPARRSLILAE